VSAGRSTIASATVTTARKLCRRKKRDVTITLQTSVRAAPRSE
jgi:hypothetical protein